MNEHRPYFTVIHKYTLRIIYINLNDTIMCNRENVGVREEGRGGREGGRDGGGERECGSE